MCAVLCESVSVVLDSVWPYRWWPTRLLCGISRLEYWSGLPCPPPGEMNEVNSVLNSLLDIADHRLQRAEQG